MAYLSLTFHFGYADLMDMEHSERIKWVELAGEYNEEQKKYYENLAREAKKGYRKK